MSPQSGGMFSGSFFFKLVLLFFNKVDMIETAIKVINGQPVDKTAFDFNEHFEHG